jgi:hypothetical protein
VSIDRIDRRRVAWCLVIDGLAHRYYSGAAPGSNLTAGRMTDYDTTVVQSPTDVDALVSVGEFSASIDDRAGIAVEEPLTLTLLARDAHTAAGVRVHPMHTMMRVAGPAASRNRIRLLTALGHAPALDGPVDVEVEDDVSGWGLPGPIYIGQETLWADGADGTGSDVDPYRFTDCTRAAGGWAAQAHYVDAAAGEQPYVTSDVVAWRGRRARVFVGALLSTGAVESWSEYYSGLLDGPAQHAGEVLTLRIVPLTAVVRYRLGVGSAARVATSVDGAHRFVRGTADEVRLTAVWRLDDVELNVSSADDAADTVTVVGDALEWLTMMGLEDGGAVITYRDGLGVVYEDTVQSASGAVLQMSAGSTLVTAVDGGLDGFHPVVVRINGTYREELPLLLTDPAGAAKQDVEWPARLVEVVNEGGISQDGPVDSWADPSADSHQARIARASLRLDDSPALLAWVADCGEPAPSPVGRYFIASGGRSAWCCILTAAGDITDVRERGRAFAENRSGAFAGRWQQLDGDVTHRYERRQDPHAFALPPQAVWFYRSGEQWLGPFSANIYTGAAGEEQLVRVTTAGPARHVWIDDVESATHPGTGETVYFYQVVERHRDTTHSIMVLQGEEPAQVSGVASATDSDPGAYIRSLLVSGVGNGDHGPADTMPIGANLPASAVNGTDFARLAAPEALRRQDYEAVRGKTIAEQVEGLLIACGAQLAARYISGGWKLGLVPLGIPSTGDSVLTLTDDDLVPVNESPVVVSVDGRTVRSVVVRMLADRAEDPVETPVALGVETADAGGDAGQPMTLDIPGVVIPSAGGRAQAVVEVVADLRARVGVPRVRWSIRIRADMPGALTLGLGDVVTLTSAHAYGIDPTEDASGAVCRVLGVRRDLVAGTLDLELRPYAGLAGGWGPALYVTQVISSTKVRVSAALYADADISHFSAGDAVDCVPVGDWAGRTSTTIASIGSEPSITTADPHGLAVGDTVRLSDYTSATTERPAVVGYAWPSSDAGTVDGDPGQVIA